ncbi:MAG: nucleotidyltransferase domain-containing protein [Pseudomonadales bacterium]|nr:nucleotidyltransferase domain-containing protein [Pseudomonadales bacterium]
MPSTFKTLYQKGLLSGAPKFLESATHYEVIMGSMAYGVSSDSSDMDVYGFAIPAKDDVFPHLRGEIPGFDECQPQFQQYQIHHVWDQQALAGKGREYDLTIYSIVKYFRLLTENNPNIIDSLFVPANCILHATQIAEMVREKRQLFLHKGCWVKFKGYAYSQLHKMETKEPIGKRKETIAQFGYDVKFAYHVVRLLLEVEQLLLEADMDLMRHKEQLKAIRRGDWSIDDVKNFFSDKEKALEKLYLESRLPAAPNKEAIRQLLLDCLEHHYGSLGQAVVVPDKATQTLNAIKALLND